MASKHLSSDSVRYYYRFERNAVSEICTCKGCHLFSKSGVVLPCDCDPANEVVSSDVKRTLNDGKCCELCSHVYLHFKTCECQECKEERILKENEV